MGFSPLQATAVLPVETPTINFSSSSAFHSPSLKSHPCRVRPLLHQSSLPLAVPQAPHWPPPLCCPAPTLYPQQEVWLGRPVPPALQGLPVLGTTRPPCPAASSPCWRGSGSVPAHSTLFTATARPSLGSAFCVTPHAPAAAAAWGPRGWASPPLLAPPGASWGSLT